VVRDLQSAASHLSDEISDSSATSKAFLYARLMSSTTGLPEIRITTRAITLADDISRMQGILAVQLEAGRSRSPANGSGAQNWAWPPPGRHVLFEYG